MFAQRRWALPLNTRSLVPALVIALFLLTALAARAQATTAVTIKGFAFDPNPVTVKVGDTVTWTNQDTAPHDVTSQGTAVLASPTLKTGESFSFTATTPGSINYICTIHPRMTATLVVQAAGAAPSNLPASGGGGMAARGSQLEIPLLAPLALGLLGLIGAAGIVRRRRTA